MGEGMKKFPVTDRKGQEGFTLLEAMVSLTILAVGILGVIGMFVTSIGGNAQGRHMTEATSLAQSKLDELANMVPYVNLADDSETGLNPDGSISASGLYNRSWTVTQPVGALDMMQITGRVEWTTKGRTHEIEMSSLRYKD